MSDLGLTLPLRLRRLAESYIITDAAGRTVSATYFTADPDSRMVTRRVGPEEAERVAKVIARAVTAAIEGA